MAATEPLSLCRVLRRAGLGLFLLGWRQIREVKFGRFDRGMTKDLLQGVDRAAAPEIIDGKPMPQIMEPKTSRFRSFLDFRSGLSAPDNRRKSAGDVEMAVSRRVPECKWASEPLGCAG